MSDLDAIVTYHANPYRSGVARFDQVLADRLSVPLLSLREPDAVAACRRPLLSFKVGELPPDACAALDRLLDELPAWGCFLHELCGSPLEDRIVSAAEPLLAGND